MGSLYFKLRKFTIIQLLVMSDVVVSEGPLQNVEAPVFLLIENSHDGSFSEGQTPSVAYPTFGQRIRDLSEQHAICKGLVHEVHCLCLLLYNLKMVDYPSVTASLRAGCSLKNGMEMFLSLRFIGGSAEGTSEYDQSVSNEAYTANYLTIVSTSVGVTLR